MRLSFLSILLLITTSSLHIRAEGDNVLVIQGQLLDSGSSKGVPFALIFTNDTKKATTSNAQGYFELYVKQNNPEEITIESIGYKSKSITISPSNKSDTLRVFLKQDFIDMDEVVVTATRSNRTLKEVPVLTQTINRNQISRVASTCITDVINSYTAFADFYNEGRGMTFRTQGLSTKYTLFLIDGERIAGENRDNIDYYRLNASSIERVEIIPGASSSLYGSNAIGSVINLITRTPRKPFEISTVSSFSNFNEFENSVSIGSNQRKFNFYANALRRTSQGYDNTPVETPNLYTVEPFEVHSAFSKLNYQISDALDVEGRFSTFIRERFNAVNHTPVHPLYTDMAGGIRVNYQISDRFRSYASIYRDTYRSYDVLERLNNQRRKVYLNSQTTGKILFFSEASKGKTISHSFTGGVELFYDEMFAERIQDSTKTNQVASIFIQDEIEIGSNFSLVAGARADFNKEYGNAISPKISAMYKLGNFNLRTSYAQGFRAPSIKERFYDFDISFVTVFGNQNLVPEESTYISASVEYLTNSNNFSLNAYRNNIANMIHEVKLDDVFNGYTYENFLNVLVRGFDLNARTRISHGLNLTASYSFVDALDVETSAQLVGVSKHIGTIMLDYMHRWQRVTAGATLSSKMYSRKEFVNIDYNTGEMFNDWYPAYSIWRLSTSYQFLNHSTILYAGIDNLLNYRAISDLICNDPGRRLFLTLSVSIDNLYNQLKN